MDPAKRKRILTLSASKIALWRTCPMAFFLRYIEPTPDATENMVLTFGKAIHSTLNRFYGVNYKSAESFSKYWKHYWFATCSGDLLKGKKKENTQIREHQTKKWPLRLREDITAYGDKVGEFFGYMKVGENILTRFYNRHKTKAPPFEREKRRTVNMFGHDVIVIFDRLDNLDGGWYLTDYKTDRTCPNEDSFILHRNPQFTIYSKAFRDLFNEDEKVILYYHLRTGKVLKTYRSQRDFDYLERLLETTKRGIERALDTGDFVPVYDYRCKSCAYKIGCDKYSLAYGGPTIAEGGAIVGAEEFTGWYLPEELSSLLVEER